MPRTEKAIDPKAGPVAEFAIRLRQVRKRAGITYRELAARTTYSHAHMVRAAKGDQLPSWLVTRAYLEACGITSPRFLKLWGELWIATNEATKAAANNPDRGSIGSLQHITTLQGFGEHLRTFSNSKDLRDVRERNEPREPYTLRELQKATGIPRSTLADWFSGRALPSVGRLYLFAGSLGATQQEQTELRQLRDRLAREQGDQSTSGRLLLALRALETTTVDAFDRWQLNKALVEAGEQRLHNDGVLSTWSSTDFGLVPAAEQFGIGKHRASTAAELDRARRRAEDLARKLQSHRHDYVPDVRIYDGNSVIAIEAKNHNRQGADGAV
jgi:transcriptional regulator with XRE-family HTH domain